MKHTTHLVLLDAHELVRKGLRSLLEHEPDLLVVGEAGTLADGLSLVARLRPHLVLLDMTLPDASGMDACRQLLKATPPLRLLALTSYAEESMVACAIRSGVHGYLLKDTNAKELVGAIRTVVSGRSYFDPRIIQHAFHWIRTRTLSEFEAQGIRRLSPQERLIMPLLAQGKTNKEIATQLRLSDKTIKNYLANIYDKLGVHRRTEAVAWFARESRSDYPTKPT